jgi:hypothetical protein
VVDPNDLVSRSEEQELLREAIRELALAELRPGGLDPGTFVRRAQLNPSQGFTTSSVSSPL